jgi:Skp family chaperone for outer membrane proteins
MLTRTRTRSFLTALGVAAALVVIAALSRAQSTKPAAPGGPQKLGTDTNVQPLPAPNPAEQKMDADRKAEIKAIDEKIKTLRDDFKSQTEPLESQIKALRDKFDADLKSLQQQKQGLVEEGESTQMRALDEEEASQLSALSDREKAEIDKLRQSYDTQREQLRQSFAQRRKDLSQHKM